MLNALPLHAQQALSLEQCREMALKNNAQIQNANLSERIAEQQKKEAFTKYFPSISATGVGFMAEKPMMSMEMDMSSAMQPFLPTFEWMMMQGAPLDPAVLESLSQPQKIEMMKNGIIGGVMAMQPIFTGGQIVNGNRLAKAGIEVSHLQKQLSENEVLLTTERFFWQIVSLKEKMKTIDNSTVMLNRILMDVKTAVEAGLTTRNDLLRVELEQNRLQSGKLKVENGLQILKMSLGQYIGLPADSFEIETPPSVIAGLTRNPQNKEGIAAFAAMTNSIEHRPEYQLLEKSVEVARLQHKMEIGKLLPTVAIGAGYNWIKMDLKKQTEQYKNIGLAFATVSIPITDWWGGSHALKQKKLEVLKAENTKREKSDLLRLQIQQVGNELNEAYQQILLAEKSMSSAEENLKISRDNYNAGVTTLSDLLEAQNLVQQSRDQYTEAAAGYNVKLAEYKIVTGR
ncbi:MAG: TolC family protein [Dysgonamonadaceae bacterium]|nr:TolC family protein [Dysgonamonadaceae bacterium]